MSKESTPLNIEQMQEAGLHFGHNVSRLHPKMKPFIGGTKNNVHVFDLEKTAKEFDRALAFIAKAAADGKTFLFVGTKIQVKGITKAAAEECKMPYVVERWLGGTFTNFETISKRVQYYKDLENKKLNGELAKYTKKEQLMFGKEIESLEKKFQGIKHMVKLPEVVIILDMRKDLACALEAKRKGITIVGVTDSNIDPTMANYAIPANDDAISSIKYILEQITKTIINK